MLGSQNLNRQKGVVTAACNPLTDVAGIKVWLKIESLSGNSNGASLAAWNDSSSNGLNFSQAGAAKPTYSTTAGPGGGPAVVTATQYMTSAATTQAQPFTVIAVVATTNVVGFIEFYFGTANSSNITLYTNTNGTYNIAATTALSSSTGLAVANVWHTWAAIYNSTSSELWIDGGTAVAGPGNAGTNGFSSAGMEIGGVNGASLAATSTEFTDLLVYSGALTTAQINTVAGCVAGLRGLSWSPAL